MAMNTIECSSGRSREAEQQMQSETGPSGYDKGRKEKGNNHRRPHLDGAAQWRETQQERPRFKRETHMKRGLEYRRSERKQQPDREDDKKKGGEVFRHRKRRDQPCATCSITADTVLFFQGFTASKRAYRCCWTNWVRLFSRPFSRKLSGAFSRTSFNFLLARATMPSEPPASHES